MFHLSKKTIPAKPCFHSVKDYIDTKFSAHNRTFHEVPMSSKGLLLESFLKLVSNLNYFLVRLSTTFKTNYIIKSPCKQEYLTLTAVAKCLQTATWLVTRWNKSSTIS